jgi:hypothetical protein
MPPHQSKLHDGAKHRVRANLHARGPRRIRHRTPLLCTGASPRPPQSSHSGLVPKIPPRKRAEMPHPPKLRNNAKTSVEVQIHLVASHREKQSSSSQHTKVVARAVIRQCTTPGGSNNVEATCHDPLQSPPLSLPQAPSHDVVPHHTGHCINASRRSPLQEVETTAGRRPLASNKKAAASDVRKATPFLTSARQGYHNDRSNHGRVGITATERGLKS